MIKKFDVKYNSRYDVAKIPKEIKFYVGDLNCCQIDIKFMDCDISEYNNMYAVIKEVHPLDEEAEKLYLQNTQITKEDNIVSILLKDVYINTPNIYNLRLYMEYRGIDKRNRERVFNRMVLAPIKFTVEQD